MATLNSGQVIGADGEFISLENVERYLGTPGIDGYVLSSQSTGERYWQIGGAQGTTGIQGPQGIQGIQGLPGVNAPKFVSTGLFSTNATTNTLLTSILIPANTFSANDAFNVDVQMVKGAGFLAYLSLRINTTPLVAGSTEIAFAQGGNSGNFLFFGVKRTYFINGGTTYSFPASASNFSDEVTSLVTGSNLTIDWTQNQYIIVSGRVANAGITVTCRGIRIY